jgi:hypothetical protein
MARQYSGYDQNSEVERGVKKAVKKYHKTFEAFDKFDGGEPAWANDFDKMMATADRIIDRQKEIDELKEER